MTNTPHNSGNSILAALELQGWPLDDDQRELLSVPAEALAGLLALLREEINDIRSLDRARGDE